VVGREYVSELLVYPVGVEGTWRCGER
jgi:hypothetical protein